MKRVRAVLFALVLVTPALSQANPLLPGAPDTVPLLYACVNAECHDLSRFIERIPDEKTIYGINTGELPIEFADGSVRVTGVMNPDPFITFGATTLNFIPGPVTYAFLFGTPIVPGTFSGATSTGGVTVTNGLSGTSSAASPGIYPTYISGYGTVAIVPTNLGVDLGTATCTAGPGAPATMTTVCGQGTLASSFAPTFYDNLEALLTYTQSDIASVVSWSGAVTLDPTVTIAPEPTLLLLGGTALAGFAARRRRR
jgi:hypothetical protein